MVTFAVHCDKLLVIKCLQMMMTHCADSLVNENILCGCVIPKIFRKYCKFCNILEEVCTLGRGGRKLIEVFL